MSNPANKKQSREEELAFLCIEKVLGVEIELADAGSGEKTPDGRWKYPNEPGWQAVVEVTSPPATEFVREWVQRQKDGQLHKDESEQPLYFGRLHEKLAKMLGEAWAKDNFEKLIAQPANERHLFLVARKWSTSEYFARLSDTDAQGNAEYVGDIDLPQGITDIWFLGRGVRRKDRINEVAEVFLARFQAVSGWHRYRVTIDATLLPAPPHQIAEDDAPSDWRHPKDRTPMALSD